MKPRMRAFSGRVTLLAVLNISCAANICSLCGGEQVWVPGPRQPTQGTAAPQPRGRHPAPPTYRERQVLLGLLLGRGLGLGGHHGHRRRLGGGGNGWGRGGRQGRAGCRGRGGGRAWATVVHGCPLLELCRQRGAWGTGLLGRPAGLQAGFPGRWGCKRGVAW